MIITKTPYRISLFGGGSDHPKWFNINGGGVVSFTIDKFCYISCRYLPPFFEYKHRFVYSKIENINNLNEIIHPAIKGVFKKTKWDINHGLEIHHDGDLPARSGMGSSSSFTVGLLNAIYSIRSEKLNTNKLAYAAIDTEQRIIGEFVGSQDQVAASYGGFNKIDFYNKNKFKVTPFNLKDKQIKEIEDNSLLIFSGFSRVANKIEKNKFSNIKSVKNQIYEIMKITKDATNMIKSNFNYIDLGKMLDETWRIKKTFSTKVSNSLIEKIYNSAKKNGAIGGKVLGAGGGGFLLIIANKKYHSRIKKNLKKFVFVPFKINFEGSKVVLNQPDGL